MSLYQAIILAIVQGITEFLPISSTAHLILFPWLFGWTDPGLAFDVALHVGTLFAVLIYFLRDWVELTLAGLGFNFPNGATPGRIALNHGATPGRIALNRRMFWYLVAGTVPAAFAGFFFEHIIEDRLRFPLPIAGAMIVIGVLMWYAERAVRLTRTFDQTSLTDSLAIGTAQAFALFPGVSRSGITIVGGLFRGMTRETAARFSFLLSTPIIAGAALKEAPKLLKMAHAGTLGLPLSTLLVAIAVSAIVGYLGIAFFLRYLQTRTLKIFIYYRIAFGIVVLLLVFLHFGSAR